jgi:hypothetical protein
MMAGVAALLLWLGAFMSLEAQQRTAASGDTLRLNLSTAVSRGVELNEQVRTTRAAREVAEGQVVQARAGALPQVNGVLTYNRALASLFEGIDFGPPPGEGEEPGENPFAALPFGQANTWNAMLTVSQPLYAAGRISTGLDIARQVRRAAELEVVEAETEVALQVRRKVLNHGQVRQHGVQGAGHGVRYPRRDDRREDLPAAGAGDDPPRQGGHGGHGALRCGARPGEGPAPGQHRTPGQVHGHGAEVVGVHGDSDGGVGGAVQGEGDGRTAHAVAGDAVLAQQAALQQFGDQAGDGGLVQPGGRGDVGPGAGRALPNAAQDRGEVGVAHVGDVGAMRVLR